MGWRAPVIFMPYALASAEEVIPAPCPYLPTRVESGDGLHRRVESADGVHRRVEQADRTFRRPDRCL